MPETLELQQTSTEVEIWKDIKGFEGTYMISSLGNVKSLSREVNNGTGRMMLPERILTNSESHRGSHFRVVLQRRPESPIVYLVKDLVAEYFIEFEPEEGYTKEFYSVFHKDNDRTNNRMDNLYYDFNTNAIRVYDYEGYWLGDYPSTAKASEVTGVHQSSILDIANGTLLSVHGFQFRRLTKEQTIFKLPSLYLDRRGNTVPIAKYWGDRLVCVYNSMSEAAEKNNILDVRGIQGSVERGTKVKGATYKKIQ